MRDGDGAIDRARECCEPSKCDTCGLQSRKHWTRCDACSAREREAVLQRAFDKAKKITPAEWGDPVVDPTGRAGNDGWCSDLETLREHYELQDADDFPKWAWATVKHGGFRPQADRIIEDIVQEMHEDAAEDFDEADLQKRLNEWFDAQTAHTYSEDDSIAIILDADFWDFPNDNPSDNPSEDGEGLAAPLPVLSVYRNEVIEWIIALSVEDAWKIWEEQSPGETRSDYAEMEWEIVEKPFKMWVGPSGKPCEVGDGDLVEHTPDEWIAICGRGYLGSTEY